MQGGEETGEVSVDAGKESADDFPSSGKIRL